MTRKIKLSFILTSVVLLIVAVSTVGVSFALWTNQGGIGEGNNSVSPTVIADEQYVWAKYFNVETYQEGEHNFAVIGTFYDANAGVNLEDVIIPELFDIDGTKYQTYRISNKIFMDSTLKKLPVTIYIPRSVMQIDAMAFANLPNLKKVVFLGGGELGTCNIDAYAFAGCKNLVSVEGERNIKYSDTAFIGCDAGLTKPESK